VGGGLKKTSQIRRDNPPLSVKKGEFDIHNRKVLRVSRKCEKGKGRLQLAQKKGKKLHHLGHTLSEDNTVGEMPERKEDRAQRWVNKEGGIGPQGVNRKKKEMFLKGESIDGSDIKQLRGYL